MDDKQEKTQRQSFNVDIDYKPIPAEKVAEAKRQMRKIMRPIVREFNRDSLSSEMYISKKNKKYNQPK